MRVLGWLLALLAVAKADLAHLHQSEFTIVIDAGSTGCRLYVYHAGPDGTLTGKKGLKVKPGLSSFAKHPQDLAEYIKPLFVEAQELVPADQLAYTKVYLKATAGMRLVTEEQGRVIYDTVYDYLSHASDVCPFSVSRQDFRTIDGKEEGYFGALSANYLSGVIDKDRAVVAKSHPILGALDLGGSSTQISLHVGHQAASTVGQSDFFVHSYLGYGVEKMLEKYRASLSGTSDPCEPVGLTYTAASGATVTGTGDYSQCKAGVAAAMGIGPCYTSSTTSRCEIGGVTLPFVGPDTSFLGMSVYYFSLRTLLIWGQKTGGGKMSWPSPSMEEVRVTGASFCSTPITKMEAILADDGQEWEGFMGDAAQRKSEAPQRCMQAAYIDVLLTRVYGVPAEKHNVMIALDINDMEVEWTLGSVLHNRGANAELEEADGTDGGSVGFAAIAMVIAGFMFLLVCFRKVRSRDKPKGKC